MFTYDGTMSSEDWVPDRRTLSWVFGTAHEDRIVHGLAADVKSRTRDIPYDSEAYWRIVAEVAIECVVYDLGAIAAAMGVTVTDR
ncbi:MAG: hypothetical protein ACREQ5_37295 [Candidatus Dormibacteria bacterium]